MAVLESNGSSLFIRGFLHPNNVEKTFLSLERHGVNANAFKTSDSSHRNPITMLVLVFPLLYVANRSRSWRKGECAPFLSINRVVSKTICRN